MPWKTACQFLKKLDTDLPYDASIPLPVSTYPREMKLWPRKRLYVNVHSSISHSNQKVGLSQMPSNEAWINRVQPLRTVLFGNNKNKVLIQSVKEVNLKTLH